jgi:type IV pilus assembly protein PilE
MTPLSFLPFASTRRSAGFTLIELMITVAIVAILASIAYPSYTDYVRRSRIADVTTQLAAVRVRLEQHYQDKRSYNSTAAVCGVAMPAAADFTLSCTWGGTSSNQTFVLTATGNADSLMSGYAYTVNDENAQRTTAFPGATVPASCWLKRKGDSC